MLLAGHLPTGCCPAPKLLREFVPVNLAFETVHQVRLGGEFLSARIFDNREPFRRAIKALPCLSVSRCDGNR